MDIFDILAILIVMEFPLVVMIMGFLMILKPETLWKLKHRFSVKGGEPTEFYFTSSRILGVVCIIFAVFFAIVLMRAF